MDVDLRQTLPTGPRTQASRGGLAATRPAPLRDLPVAAAALTPVWGGAPSSPDRIGFKVWRDSDPRVRVGFLVMCALEQMADRAGEAGTGSLVALFPTKGSVFWLIVTGNQEVDVLDVLEVLGGAPERLYYENVDSHPNAAANRRIAATGATRAPNAHR